MTNATLARDYLERSKKRLRAVAFLFGEQAYPDVVRDSQSVVELGLKALLRSFGLTVPHSHDLSHTLLTNRDRFAAIATDQLERWAEISKLLRRDRELSFYGSEDVTPSEFYTREDAAVALAMAEEVIRGVEPWIR